MNSQDKRHAPRAVRHVVAAALLVSTGLPDALAFGGVGSIAACTSFTTCTAELYSFAGASVVHEVTAISAGYNLPTGLLPGTTIRADPQSTATTMTVRAGDDPAAVPSSPTPFAGFSFAQAQTDFGTHRGEGWSTLGARGIDRQGSASAMIDVRTAGVAESAWRDVFTFTRSGHWSSSIDIDGRSASAGNSFPSSFQVLASSAVGGWSYELDVWDVSRLVPDPDGFLAPTLVASLSDGGLEQRSSFASQLRLDFDFLAGSSYVVISRLSTFARNGRDVDLFNTVRLTDVTLSDGAVLSALSGHDYVLQAVAPVPEPSTWLLLAGGLAAMARIARRRGRDASAS